MRKLFFQLLLLLLLASIGHAKTLSYLVSNGNDDAYASFEGDDPGAYAHGWEMM